jgi:hypothetical protein
MLSTQGIDITADLTTGKSSQELTKNIEGNKIRWL